eukprot:2145582-Amphidinium_carterae.1
MGAIRQAHGIDQADMYALAAEETRRASGMGLIRTAQTLDRTESYKVQTSTQQGFWLPLLKLSRTHVCRDLALEK